MGPILRIIAVAIVAHVCFRIIRSPDWEIVSKVAKTYFVQLKDLKFNLIEMGMPQSWDEEAAIVIVGAGSAGLTAALEAGVHLNGQAQGHFDVIVLEKETFVGGNSMKASSGMNAYIDSTLSTGDSIDQFKRDTLASGGGLSDESLVDVLVHDSGSALEFIRGLGVDLAKNPVQLGGHSQPRTYTVVNGAVGASLVKALEKAVRSKRNIDIRTGSKVARLVYENDRVQGVVYDAMGSDGTQTRVRIKATRGVILASGGFGANRALLGKYVSQLNPIFTTNGKFAMGEGIDMGKEMGALVKQISQIQIHPTGFVDPANPNGLTKILAPEKLRGLGGILVDSHGNRFVNELDTRDKVTEAILQLDNKTALLVMSEDMATRVGPAMKFYLGKGLFRLADSISQLVTVTNTDKKNLLRSLESINRASKGDTIDSMFPRRSAYHPFDLNGKFLYARVTPTVHYTMGGLAVNQEGRILRKTSAEPIPGLFAAGEVTGGVHGKNRLGGNSLLECIVFGRRAGKAAATSQGSL